MKYDGMNLVFLQDRMETILSNKLVHRYDIVNVVFKELKKLDPFIDFYGYRVDEEIYSVQLIKYGKSATLYFRCEIIDDYLEAVYFDI